MLAKQGGNTLRLDHRQLRQGPPQKLFESLPPVAFGPQVASSQLSKCPELIKEVSEGTVRLQLQADSPRSGKRHVCRGRGAGAAGMQAPGSRAWQRRGAL